MQEKNTTFSKIASNPNGLIVSTAKEEMQIENLGSMRKE